MRILCLGLDGADYDLVSGAACRGPAADHRAARRPGRVRTAPLDDPGRHADRLVVLPDRAQPGRARHLQLLDEPEPQPAARRERGEPRRAPRSGVDSAAAGIRSAFVAIPFTYPAEPIDGIVVTGYGGPERPQILPETARGPDPRRPSRPRHGPSSDGRALVGGLRGLREPARRARRRRRPTSVASASSSSPTSPLLCVDFMSSDHAGHLGYDRLDPDHPAHDPAQRRRRARPRVRGGRPGLRRARRRGRWHLGRGADRGHPLRPRHEADLLDVPREPLARGSGTSPLPPPLAPAAQGRRPERRCRRSTSGSPGRPRWYGRALDRVPLPPRPAAGPGVRRHRLRLDASVLLRDGRPDLPRRGERCAARPGATPSASPTSSRPSGIPRPESRLSTSGARRSCTTAPYLDKAPELVILPRDERIHVDSSRRAWPRAFELHDRLDPEVFYGYSGHHGLTGILAAAGPGIRPGSVPAGSEITQLPATILRLLGLAAEGLDGGGDRGRPRSGRRRARHRNRPRGRAGRGVRLLRPRRRRGSIEHLRDLGYE